MDKLKKTKQFQDIYNKNLKIYTKYTIIFHSNNKDNESKFGFVASKKTGKAVKRNRIKRLFREIVRLNLEKFNKNNNYIIVGKSNLKEIDITYKKLEKDIIIGIKKIK